MASNISNYAANKLLDHITGKTTFTKPTVWVGLSTASPLDDASGLAEPSSNGYTRAVTSGATWDAAVTRSADNASAITFPEATGSWGTLTHFALFDAFTSGNMLAWGELTSPEAIGNGQTPRYSAGALTIAYTASA